MERFFAKKHVLWILVYILLGLLILYMLMKLSPLLSGVFSFLRAVFIPFIVAMLISYLLNPVVEQLHQRKVPRTMAVLIIYFVFIILVIVLFINIAPLFVKQCKELMEHAPQLIAKAQKWFEALHNNKLLPVSIRDGIQRFLSKVENSISTEIANVSAEIGATLDLVFMAFIIPFLAFYMMKDMQMIEKTVLMIMPRNHRQRMVKLAMNIDKALGSYIRGQLIVCIIIGVLAYIGYWLIGMPYPLLLAAIVSLFNIIPYIGPFFGAIPAMMMAFTISFKMVLMVVLVNLIVQTLEGNIISPHIVGRKLHLHPLIIIFALLVGGELAGILGLILAIPFVAVLKVIIYHVYENDLEHRRDRSL